jgi:hypothetical protein
MIVDVRNKGRTHDLGYLGVRQDLYVSRLMPVVLLVVMLVFVVPPVVILVHLS